MDWTGKRSKGTPAVPGRAEQGLVHVRQFGADMVEGAEGQLQRGRRCYTILISENAI